MTTINVPIGPPYGTIPINTNAICAAIPDPVSPAAASDLLIDSAGGRSINALVEIAELGGMLGNDFVEARGDFAIKVDLGQHLYQIGVLAHRNTLLTRQRHDLLGHQTTPFGNDFRGVLGGRIVFQRDCSTSRVSTS